ncbi:hypothetical protein Tco_0018301 [Tanacetum coccineum]
MGEPLSPDRVFDFPVDEPEPHPAYNFFAHGSLPSYASNPNNNNGWIEVDIPLLEELGEMGEPQGAEVDEPMVAPAIEKVVEPMVEAEEQTAASVIDMKEDLAKGRIPPGSGPYVSVYNRFAQLMNDLERNNMNFPTVTINTKFLNSLQPEWLKYVTQVRLAKRLTVDSFDDLFDYLQQFEKLVNASRA